MGLLNRHSEGAGRNLADYCVTMLKLLLLTLCVISQVRGHRVVFGSCPDPPPAEGFRLDDFVGAWYVIAKTKIDDRCLVDYVANIRGTVKYADRTYDADAGAKFINLTAVVKWTDTQGKFSQSYGGYIPDATFTVMSLNFDTYATLYKCQQWPLFHRESISILARKPEIKKGAEYTQLINIIKSNDLSVKHLKKIDQKDCDEAEELTAVFPDLETNNFGNSTFEASEVDEGRFRDEAIWNRGAVPTTTQRSRRFGGIERDFRRK